MWRWTRLISAKWEDAWAERLLFLGPGRVAFIGWPDGKRVRVEAFVEEKEVRGLVREFGGKAAKARLWTGDPQTPRAPLNIRGKLRIFSDPEPFEAGRKDRRKAILIPSGMAFGTGEHATTASCLRMLCDVAGGLKQPWTAVDAGTGSGILAIAASALGAERVEAFDFDPACVRISKVNARANGMRNIRIKRADVLEWSPAERHEVVVANLFSDLLIRAAPILKRAVRSRGGVVIFSGVLRTQLEEVRGVFEGLGFDMERTVVRGKWSAGLCRRPDGTSPDQ